MKPDISLRLRKLDIHDLQDLQTIGRASYVPYYTHIWEAGGVDWYMDQCFGHAVLARDLTNPNVEYYFAEDTDHEAVVGLLKLQPGVPILHSDGTPSFYLEKIYLMPDYFGKGIGHILIEEVVMLAKSTAFNTIWLQVMQTGPVKFYEKAGFVIERPVRFEYDFLLPELRDGWVMTKQV